MSDDIYKLAIDLRERVRYLNEIGVDSVSENVVRPVVPYEVRSLPPVDIPNLVPSVDSEKLRRPPGSRLAELPSLSQRKMPVRPNSTESEPLLTRLETDVPIMQALAEPSSNLEGIEAIRSEIGNCVRCPLHEGRTQIVHSMGNFSARLMFVGEAPGADEDAAGQPFVGRAGKLLTDIIISMGFRREDVFIGNINRCRPPGNRQPLPIETEACRPFLLREVDVIKPRVIVVLGNTATQNLLGIKTPISKIRGEFQEYFGVKVMPTFHPAYLLRDPHKKREVWEDMKKVRDYINTI